MTTEQHSWNILSDHFTRKGFVNHQIESFDRFLNVGIQDILEKEPPIQVQNGDATYTTTFSDVHIPYPSVMEMDRAVHDYYPAEARRRNLTYESPVYVKVTETLQEGDREQVVNVHPRIPIAHIPIMLRSDRCHLSKCTPQERVQYGECEKDEGGYFIINGIERVLIGQIRNCYNIPLVFEQKPGSKYKYVCEVRSMSESTGHSVQIKAAIGTNDRTLVFLLPHMKDTVPVPIGVVFKALGYTTSEEIADLIGLNVEKAQKYIKLILRDSFIAESKEEALEFIGKNAKHPPVPAERISYARQVVEKELFPHLGITVSNKDVAYFLGYMVHKLLATRIGMRKDDNRDNYMNKRVEVSGVLCNELFRQLYKRYLSSIASSLEKKKQSWDIISTMSRMTLITKGIRKCFSTGKWGATKTDYVRVGVSQVLSRLSYGATLSHLRRINIPIGKEAKNSKIRQIDPSQIMFLCPAECFDPKTPILMWDGSIKLAQNIVVGDILVDDQGNATRVRSTCDGFKEMYNIIPDKSNFLTHTVTDNHILTLKYSGHKSVSYVGKRDRYCLNFYDKETYQYRGKYFETKEEAIEYGNQIDYDDIVDITIDKYLQLHKNVQNRLVLFKTRGINWTKQEVAIDPYLLGMWLGDGLNTGYGFVSADKELIEYWKDWGSKNDATITHHCRYQYGISSTINNTQDGMNCNKTESAPLAKLLQKYKLIKNKHIPIEYIVNDRETRLKVLAGLIDTDGNVRANGREIRICQASKNYHVIDGAYKIAMSLGFPCSVREGVSQWTDEKTKEKRYGEYKELTITGYGIEEIPTILPRKKIMTVKDSNSQRLKSFLGSRFSMKRIEMSPFVGWQLEGSGRFLLGDGTTTHNTPEGQSIGIVLNLSLMTRVSQRRSTVLVREAIENSSFLTHMSGYEGNNEDTKVFLNGTLIGMTEDSYGLIDELCEFRDTKLIPWDVSINHDPFDDEIHIASDEGRLLRPIFTINGDKLNITEEDGSNWDDLVERGLVKYVDNSEINNAVVAFYPSELEKYSNDYCEIAPSMMLGVMASIIPFPDHSQSPRNCYQAAMGKQAMGMVCLSHLIRTDTILHVLRNPQKPLVYTKPSEMMGFNDMPSGINAIVAIACYGGWNQEDSVILNADAVQRGLFWADTFQTFTEEEKKRGTHMRERIGVPPLNKRMKRANYTMLDESGVVKKGMYVEKGDVIISKMSITKQKKSRNEDEEEEVITDSSVILKTGEEGWVDRVISSITPDGYRLVKVVLRTTRIPEVGDKFASRAAQKGTCGMTIPQIDMPFTASGVVPDIIINPHAMPSRMTVNQLIECVMGKCCVMEGTFGDATPFTESSVNIAETVSARLEKLGFSGDGTEVMYNGMTGEPMQARIFIGPTYYQRLKHLVSDKMHARATGHYTTLTRQPLEGRSRDGGLRFGEMERDCMISHGAAAFLRDRLFQCSDPYQVVICDKCGNIATTQTECKACNSDEVTQVNLPYSSKLLTQLLNAMCFKTELKAKK